MVSRTGMLMKMLGCGILWLDLLIASEERGLGIIVKPPGNKTVCINNRVTINCGYDNNITLPVIWIINGTLFTQEELTNNSLYQLNNYAAPLNTSLTIASIKNSTTVQCLVQSTSNIASWPGRINVINPVVSITTVRADCGSVIVGWRVFNNRICTVRNVAIILENSDYRYVLYTYGSSATIKNLPGDTFFRVNLIVSTTNSISSGDPPAASTYVTTRFLEGPTFQSTAAKVYEKSDYLYPYRKNLVIKLSWKIKPYTRFCHGTIKSFEIKVMDMYKPVSETAFGSSRSSLFSSNRTRVVANRIYNITISAIGNGRIRYPSDPIIVNTFVLSHCDFSSPSIGIIRVSCNISHPIQVILTCTNNCNDPMVTVNGSSPLTVSGLDPGVMYSVSVTVFNNNEVGLSDQALTQDITVNEGNELNIGALVGGIIGGVVFIVIIIIIILLICCSYVSHKRKSPASDDDDDKASLQRSPMLQTSESY